MDSYCVLVLSATLQLFRVTVVIVLGGMLTACGSGNSGEPIETDSRSTVTNDSPQQDANPDVPPLIHIPANNDERERVALTLKGDDILTIPLGADYFEEGVTATSVVLGDITIK